MIQLQRFEEHIKRGLPDKLYFLFATEPFFLFEATRLIRKRFDPLSIESYESAEEVDLAKLQTTHSLFAEKRVLIVNNFEKVKKAEKRLDWLIKTSKTITPPITLLLLANCSSKDVSKELEYMKKEKINSFNLDITERELEQWLQYKAAEFGLNLKKDAMMYLIEITNGQPGIISSEIEKIALLSESREIGLSDIIDILSETTEYKTFDLIEAIQRKDRDKAFRILEQMKTTDADMLLGALNWYYSKKSGSNEEIYRLLYKANLSLRQSRSLSLDMLLYELLKR